MADKSRTRLELTPDEKKRAIGDLQDFFRDERDEEIGDLACDILLAFFSEKIGVHFYNQGIDDARRYMGERTEELYGLMR